MSRKSSRVGGQLHLESALNLKQALCGKITLEKNHKEWFAALGVFRHVQPMDNSSESRTASAIRRMDLRLSMLRFCSQR